MRNKNGFLLRGQRPCQNVTEPGSTWVRQQIDNEEEPILLAEITVVEVAAGLALKDTLAGQEIPLVFVAGDDTLVDAAQAEGLPVDNPFWHTDLDTPPSP